MIIAVPRDLLRRFTAPKVLSITIIVKVPCASDLTQPMNAATVPNYSDKDHSLKHRWKIRGYWRCVTMDTGGRFAVITLIIMLLWWHVESLDTLML